MHSNNFVQIATTEARHFGRYVCLVKFTDASEPTKSNAGYLEEIGKYLNSFILLFCLKR